MKTLLPITLSLLLAVSSLAKNLTANFAYTVFDIPQSSPFLETYLRVTGNSIEFIPKGDSLRGEIEVNWIIRSGEKIVNFDKYNLLSPALTLNDTLVPDFLDQRRISLPAGVYQVELSIRDKNSGKPATTLKEEVKIFFPDDTISMSEIELLETFSSSENNPGKFTRNGMNLYPLVQQYYPKQMDKLRFYAEVYRTNIVPAENYLVRYSISGNENRKILEGYVMNLRQSPKPVNVIMGEFPINALLSGNYLLSIEIRNKQNQLIAAKQCFFQRSNPASKPLVNQDITKLDINNTFVATISNNDSLTEYIACLYPISSSSEMDIQTNILGVDDKHFKQQYMYSFWSSRNPSDPERAWLAYKSEVEKVNAIYSTFNKKGYDTERGRVYLQYGPPNSIADGREDAESYPYEIWHYYKLKEQSNRKFVFYTVDHASNNYVLLHSDAQGEPQEPNWEVKLHRTQQYGNDWDQQTPFPVYGSDTRQNFKNPH